jgi:hypothetical protein
MLDPYRRRRAPRSPCGRSQSLLVLAVEQRVDAKPGREVAHEQEPSPGLRALFASAKFAQFWARRAIRPSNAVACVEPLQGDRSSADPRHRAVAHLDTPSSGAQLSVPG